MRIIGFTGPKGSGKDTAAKTLFKHNTGERKRYFRRAPMAEGVKNVCQEFFGWTFEQMQDFDFKETPIELWPSGPVMAPRWPMMDIANWLRDKYGGAVHAQRWERKSLERDLEGWGAHVTTDLRFPEELDIFKKHNPEFLCIYVWRSSAEEALAAKQAAGDAMALNASEAHYKMLFEYAKAHGVVVDNDRDIQHLNNQVNNAVKCKFNHWQYWDNIGHFNSSEVPSHGM